ncbi:hypothetical protein LCGC14_1376640 [marine sediment metagenome]|uniref:DDE domain-containing protein n=1 Tax=marine sediment metagenome TaxID=412755 RepID=A0A0F9K3Z0_9ZZZZ
MNILKKEKRLHVLSALVEGSSIRSTERMTGVHRDTILRFLVAAGEHCTQLLDENVQDLHCQQIQADEIWTFVCKKQKRIKEDESDEVIGDQYVFVAMDADTKLVLSFLVGKRTPANAIRFMQDLEGRLSDRTQITTDGLVDYLDAVELAFGADIDYAQLVGIPSEKFVISGTPDQKDISTTYIERQNLTMRMRMRRFTRKTNGFSKKLQNLKAAVSLHFAHYNFCRVHQSLRVTPAMEAGLADHVWGLGDLLPN